MLPRALLALLIVCLPLWPAFAVNNYENEVLGEAASFAISSNNQNLMAALMQAGLKINDPIRIDVETDKWELPLAIAVHDEQPAMAAFLVSNGADPDVRDRYDHRLIDYAVQKGLTDFYEILRIADKLDWEYDGYPQDMFVTMLKLNRKYESNGNPVFLSLNGEDPPAELFAYLKSKIPHYRLRSTARTLSVEEYGPHKTPTQFQENSSGEYGTIQEITLEPTDDERTYLFRVLNAPSEGLSGGGYGGLITKRYGYWVVLDAFSFDR